MSFSIQPSMMFLSLLSSLIFENNVIEVIENISKFPLYLGIFSIAFTPAFFEEITFRGIILKEYKNINIKRAAIINGLFFGIMHLNLQQFLYATVLGIFLTYLVYYSKSIFSSMLFHFFINASQFCMSYFTLSLNSKNIHENMNKDSYNLASSTIVVGILSIIFIPIFIILLKKFILYNKNINFKKYEQNNKYIKKEKIVDVYFILTIVIYICYNILEYIFAE